MTPDAAAKTYIKWMLRVLLPLFDLAGMQPGGPIVDRLPGTVRRQIARVMLPAESAFRRLAFFVAAHWVGPIPLRKQPEMDGQKSGQTGSRRVKRTRLPVFWLFDRRKFFPELADPSRRFARGQGPNIWSFDGPGPPRKPEKPARDPDDARRLARRMQALDGALRNFPEQVQRLLRLLEARKQAPPGPGRRGPVRAGYPPGHRHHRTHEVDEILHECAMMARSGRAPPGLWD